MRFVSTGPCLHGSRRLLVVVAVGAAVTLAAGCGSDHSADTTTRPAPATSAASTPARASGDVSTTWASPNADLANTRRVGGPIDSASVSRLRVAWRVPITGSGYASTPVVSGNVLYAQDLSSDVYAIDLATGKVRWTAPLAESDVGPNGVAVGDGRVYGATITRAFALDAKTGRQLWTRKLIRSEHDIVDIAPGYLNGTVYISTAAGGGDAVGTLWALDGATGRPKWRWEEVPATLWGDPVNNGGGGMWHTPALDRHGNVYGSVANPLSATGPSGKWAASRPGPNKWTNSIVKLDARTGAFKWGRQVLPHDIYDWDLECPVILTRANQQDVALVGGKMGKVYAFASDSGKLLWERAVGLHNGHDDDNLLALHRETASLEHQMKVLPGNLGGLESQMAIDDHTVYAAVNNLFIVYTKTDTPSQEIMKGTGEVVALDIASGRVKWAHKLPHSAYGAASVTNDLVFTTTYDGTIWALSTRTGDVAWKAQLPAGTNAPVAISGDTVIAASSVPLGNRQQMEIVAYRLGG
jgi:outer membrane protein assembly factor BamB